MAAVAGKRSKRLLLLLSVVWVVMLIKMSIMFGKVIRIELLPATYLLQ